MNMRDRFQVIDKNGETLLRMFPTQYEAFLYAKGEGPLTIVYDNMAQRGAYQEWKVSDIYPYGMVAVERRSYQDKPTMEVRR